MRIEQIKKLKEEIENLTTKHTVLYEQIEKDCIKTLSDDEKKTYDKI